MNEYDVAIVGMGPVGSAAALLFAESGLSVVAFERDREVYPLPRAVALDGEIVRAFQRFGLGEETAALLQSPRADERIGFVNSKRDWLFGAPMQSFGGNGWQPISFFHQPELDGYLREKATDHAGTKVHLGCELESFEEQGDGVVLRGRDLDSGEAVEARASYLIACDGASSPVRKALGIPWRDLGYDHDWLVVDVVALEGHTLDHDTVQVCDPDRLATYVCVKDPHRRWEFKLNPGETREEMLEPARIESLIEPWTPKGTFEVTRSAVYQFHAATAESWRVGRVLLAGDAAHQTPPFLGQGMNAGMRDVVNLSWKLARVVRGEAEAALLDSYGAERQPHAEDLVEWAVAVGRLMEHLAAVEAAARSGGDPPAEEPGQRASGYGQGREAPPLRAGILVRDQVSDEGSTGYLFSQPIVEDADGQRWRLDERLGEGFALVLRAGTGDVVDAGTRDRLDRIGVRLVRLDGLEPVEGHFDRLFEEAEAALVRPDRYVFGHTTDSLSLSDLVSQLETKLVLR